MSEKEVSISDDESIKKFVEALKADSDDLQDEDLKSVVTKACKGRPKEVKEAVLRRLGV